MELAYAAEQLKDALSSFDPKRLTAKRILETAALLFPERLGSGLWIDVYGKPDIGMTFEVVKMKKISLDALIGQATAGGAASYQFAQRGPLTVSVGIGAVTPYSRFLREWAPAVLLKVRF